MGESFDKSFEKAIKATKPKPRNPTIKRTGKTVKVRMGAGQKVHAADVLRDVDKSGRPTEGVWVRCSKSGPVMWPHHQPSVAYQTMPL